MCTLLYNIIYITKQSMNKTPKIP